MFDIWRAGYVRKPLAHVLDRKGLDPASIVWLPPCPRSFQYVADPFGIERDGVLTIFVEAFDYRVRRGEIHYLQYDADDRLVGQGVALAEPFHLSYPSLIEDGGELYMLPEGYKSGALTLYRCVRFPDRWEPVQPLTDQPAIDATVVRHGARWWMFHALPGPDNRAMRELHVAWADSLKGPWTPHANNPVRMGFEASRPGGTAFVHGGALHLPVQDCLDTYGARIRVLRIDELTPDLFEATEVRRFEPDGLLAGFDDGLHTLSGMGDLTFIDVKQINRSWAEGLIRTQYKLRRLFGLNGPQTRAA
ncbi:MAG: hypothetical protein EON90_05565 [Brevundimonas sp.]|nr:MAG: hypothetical protein EON90_05565 [Brevundimonas sp.]